MYFVGIDGGGTSCRARIRTESGQLIGEAKSGSANIMLGADVALESIVDAVSQAAQQGGLSEADFSKMHLGLALAGAEQKSSWNAFMNQPHPFASIVLNSDGFGACMGAHNGDDGAIFIAGTGSVGIYLQQGTQHIIGGREFPISDQGSGAHIGLHLIQQVILAEDGIREKTPLCEFVINDFGNDIDNIVAWSKTALPRDYGKYCPQIFEFADQGDALALELLKKSVSDIEMFLTRLNTLGATKISLMGSIAQRLESWLAPPIQQWIVPAQHDAIEGALMFAGKPEYNLY